MAVYNFSPFDPAAPPANPPEGALAGQWVDLPPGLNLPELAARLATTSDPDAVKAVPDPWAQPRSFAEALTTDKHPLKSVFRAQWRGLLALFALQKTMENIYALELRPIPLGEVPQQPGPARDEAEAAASLDRVLTALPPNLRLPGEDPQGWARPILIRLRRVTGKTQHGDPEYGEGYDVGMMNPASLVSSGRIFSCGGDEIKAEIPWLAGGLQDPLEGDLLTPGRRRILAVYLGDLYNRLSAICGAPSEDKPGWRALATEIGTFRTDCQAPEGDAEFVKEPFPTDGDLPALYAAVHWSVEEQVGPEDSECLIALQAQTKEALPFEGLILVDPGLPAALGKPASQIRVFGATMLSDIEAKSQFEATRASAAAANYLLVTVDDLFTRKLLRLDNGLVAAFPDRPSLHPASLQSSVLPLRPIVLLIYPPERLAEQITFSKGRVSLKLSLTASSGGRAVAHTVSRAFDDRIERGSWAYPDIAVWPDFASEEWKYYFARLAYATNVGDNIRPILAVSGAAIRAALEDAPRGELENAVSRFQRWNGLDSFRASSDPSLPSPAMAGDQPHFRRAEASSDVSGPIDFQTSAHPFEAVLCDVGTGPDSQEAAGLILLPLPKKPDKAAMGGRAVEIGVDFGTTNTVACFNCGGPDEALDPVVFSDRVVSPIREVKPTPLNARLPGIQWLFTEFMPPSSQATPTPTVWLEHRHARNAPPGEALLPGVIYFQPEGGVSVKAEPSVLDEFLKRLKNARFSLKWADFTEGSAGQAEDEAQKNAAEGFLRQFMIMTAAELAEKGHSPHALQWRFSYPDRIATSGGRAGLDGAFKDGVKAILGSLWPSSEAPVDTEEEAEPPADAEPAAEASNPQFSTESIAAARYVLNGAERREPRRKVTVVLDIGGGSTDATIFSHTALMWSGSLALAGIDFFTNHIIRNRDIKESIRIENWEDAIREQGAAELLFSGDVLEHQLSEVWRRIQNHESVKHLKATAYAYLGGIAYYLGLVVRRLIAADEIDVANLDDVGFGLCGRGAGLFVRVHQGAQQPSGIQSLLSLFSVAAGSAQPTPPNLITSRRPKLEVAKGMLVTYRALPIDYPSTMTAKDYPNGLAVALDDGRSLAVDSPFSEKGAANVAAIDTTEFEAFLTALAAHGGPNVTNAKALCDLIRTNGVRDQLKPDRPLAEPIFLTALRLSVDRLTRPDLRAQLKVTMP